jgi:hypothetical protein
VYDANVLYPAFLRDVLLRLAVADLVAARWTLAIHNEWMRHLRADRPDLSPAKIARVRELMDEALPHALVSGYELRMGEIAALPDADDRHVLAAAVHCGAQYIVTSNVRDFPSLVLQHDDVEARTPGEFVGMLLDADAETVAGVLERHRRGLRAPPMNVAQYREALARNHLADVVERLAARDSVPKTL